MSLLIGFGNKARHGKDSAVNAIKDHINGSSVKLAQYYGYGPREVVVARQFRFAEALYEEARTLHGMTEKDAPLLQRIGAARRAENVNYWVDKVFFGVDDFFKKNPNGVALISDVRYQNEVATLRDRGGYTINVTRLNADGSVYIAPDRPADHPSEVDLDGYNWDFFIRTRSGEEALAAEQAITLYEYIRGLRG